MATNLSHGARNRNYEIDYLKWLVVVIENSNTQQCFQSFHSASILRTKSKEMIDITVQW